MGERADVWKSNEELAIEFLARKRMENIGPSTDAIDRSLFEKYKKEVEAEFIIYNGRAPRKGIY